MLGPYYQVVNPTKLPGVYLAHSLGYTFTHLPKVDALLAKLGEK